MLVGVAAASDRLAALRSPNAPRSFFEGARLCDDAHHLGVIVVATCFGKGVENIGVKDLLGEMLNRWPSLLWRPSAGGRCPWDLRDGLPVQEWRPLKRLFNFFVEPAREQSIDPEAGWAPVVAIITASAGRTMSPVAAVVDDVRDDDRRPEPLALVRRVALPLIVGSVVVVIVAALMVS